MRLPAAVLVFALLLGPSSSDAAPRDGLRPGVLLGKVSRGTALSAYDRWIVWSSYDAQVARFRLVLFEVGKGARALSVRPQLGAFDADIGPDANGRPIIVFTRCVGLASEHQDCDVVRLDPVSGRERLVPGASTQRASEYMPRVWRDRVVFFREVRYRPGVPFVSLKPQLRTVQDGDRHSTAILGARFPTYGGSMVYPEALDVRGTRMVYTAEDAYGADCPPGEDPSGGPAFYDTWLVDLARRRQRRIDNSCYAPGLEGPTLGPAGLIAGIPSSDLADIAFTRVNLRDLRRSPIVVFSRYYASHRCALQTAAEFSGGIAVVVSDKSECRVRGEGPFTIEAFPLTGATGR